MLYKSFVDIYVEIYRMVNLLYYHLFQTVTKYTVYSTIFPSHWITFAIEYINISCEVETKPGSSKLNDQPKQTEELRLSL